MPRVRTGFLIEFGALKDYIGKSRDHQAARAWLKVKKCIENGTFGCTKYDGDLASLVMSGYDDAYIAGKFGIATDTVRGHRRNIGLALEKVLGSDFCSLFYNFEENKDTILERIVGFDTVGIRAVDLLPMEILSVPLDSSPVVGFDLVDCVVELEFLEKHSIASMKEELYKLDQAKLKYLLAVIDEKVGSFSDRAAVIKNMLPKEDD